MQQQNSSKNKKSSMRYKKLNPMENYYMLLDDKHKKAMRNPFLNVNDAAAYAKKLREQSYQ